MKTSNKYFIVFASIATILALVVILAPPVTSMLITRALYQAGADEVIVGDVDLNPLVGTARIHNMVVRKDGRRVITLDHAFINIRMTALFGKQLEIDQVALKDAYISIKESPAGNFGLKGISFETVDAPENKDSSSALDEWSFGIHEVDLDAVTIHVDAIRSASTIEAEKFLLSRIYTWDKEGISELVVRGKFNDGRFSMDTRFSPLAKLPKVTGTLKLEAIDLADIYPWINEQLDYLQGLVYLDSKIEVERKSKTEWQVQLKPNLQVDALSLARQKLTLNSNTINYNGSPSISLVTSDESVSIQIEDQGQANVQGITTGVSEHIIELENASWEGAYGVAIVPEMEPDIRTNGNIMAAGLQVKTSDEITLAKLGDVNIKEATFSLPISVSVANASIQNGLLLQSAAQRAPLLNWENIGIEGIDASQQLVKLSRVDIEALNVELRRLKDGSLYLPLPASKENSPERPPGSDQQEPKQPAESAQTAIRIDNLNISKGSQISVSDISVKPAYSANAKLTQFSISNIDTGNINQAATVDIGAIVNRYAEIKTSGTIKPFMGIPDADLKTNILGVNLTRISPYALEYSGYLIKNGNMNLESDLKIQDKIIDEKIKLKLSNLDLVVGDQKKASETDAKLAIGLPAALNLLKDSKDDIQLNLPISGDLSDPNFDFSHALTVVVSKALAKGTTAYAAYALQPWGAALLVKEVAGKMVTQVHLDPILFEAGKEELPENAALYLEKISDLMKQRPGVELKICGRATEADRIELAGKILEEKRYLKEDEPTLEQAREVIQDDDLINLAENRMFLIKDILIDRHQIAPNRIQTCLPDLNTDTNAQPAVELNI